MRARFLFCLASVLACLPAFGQSAGKLKYPAGFILSNGEIIRLMSKTDVTDMLPRGVDVAITVYTRSTGLRSDPFTFRRD